MYAPHVLINSVFSLFVYLFVSTINLYFVNLFYGTPAREPGQVDEKVLFPPFLHNLFLKANVKIAFNVFIVE